MSVTKWIRGWLSRYDSRHVNVDQSESIGEVCLLSAEYTTLGHVMGASP